MFGHSHGLNEEEIKELWVQGDIDGNGVLDYKEFLVLWFHIKGFCLLYIQVFMYGVYASFPIMAHHHNVQAMLSYHMLIAPLIPNPTSDMERRINELRIKFWTYMIEMDVEYGSVMLPMMFSYDFGDQIHECATLIDPNNNRFEELAEFGFAHMVLDRETTAIDLVDENGNVWNCRLLFSETPYANFMIGGG